MARIFVLLATLGTSPWVVAGARAQFEEPDTIPKFGLGPFIELTFRGSRGEVTGRDVGLANGPAFGGRLEYRLTPTGTIAVLGSYGSTEEEQETSAGDAARFRDLTVIQVTGELLLRLKESVPGFFIVGAGSRFVDPDGAEAGSLGGPNGASYSEPLVVGGVGLEFLFSRKNALRAAGRFYLTVPGGEPGGGVSGGFESDGLATDFALGFTYLHRF